MTAYPLPSVRLADLDSVATEMVRFLPRKLAIGLVGTLGAGKTTLVKAIAQAAGADIEDVTSPTFTLMQSHQGDETSDSLVLHHIDAYRLADEDEFLELGVDEVFEEDAWTLVEWADRVESIMPLQTLWIRIELTSGDDHRSLRMSSQCDDVNRGIAQIKHALRSLDPVSDQSSDVFDF